MRVLYLAGLCRTSSVSDRRLQQTWLKMLKFGQSAISTLNEFKGVLISVGEKLE